MTEAKIPARWQEYYEGLTASKDFATLHCNDQIKLIEELAAAEQERNEKYETISELSLLAAEAGREITRLDALRIIGEHRQTGREITRLKAEVERLKGAMRPKCPDCNSVGMSHCSDPINCGGVYEPDHIVRKRITQARKDALEKLSRTYAIMDKDCEFTAEEIATDIKRIAENEFRALADKDKV